MPPQKKVETAQEKAPLKAVDNTMTGEQLPKKIVPEKVYLTWIAKARPFKKRNRDFWITIVAIAGISGLILFFVEGYMPVLLIIALIFLAYILNTVEPEEIDYKVTNKGIKMKDTTTSWDFLTRFWFSRRFDTELLVFETLTITGRLELVIDAKDKDKIRRALKDYVTEEEVPPSNLDKAANWFSNKLPTS